MQLYEIADSSYVHEMDMYSQSRVSAHKPMETLEMTPPTYYVWQAGASSAHMLRRRACGSCGSGGTEGQRGGAGRRRCVASEWQVHVG
jgi:hypothetical protein